MWRLSLRRTKSTIISWDGSNINGHAVDVPWHICSNDCLIDVPCHVACPTGISAWPSGPRKWAATWQNQQNGCAPMKDSGQPGYPPSLIRGFAVSRKKAWVLSYALSAQQRLWLAWAWSDWADAQADLSLRWAHTHTFCWFCHVVAQMLPYTSECVY